MLFRSFFSWVGCSPGTSVYFFVCVTPPGFWGSGGFGGMARVGPSAGLLRVGPGTGGGWFGRCSLGLRCGSP